VNPGPAKYRVAVASADHVRRGVEASIMQVCHGKAAPTRRVNPGERVACYSPTSAFRGADKLQAFTAYGRVKEGDPYAFEMGDGFVPYRRDVAWERARATPIRPLLGALRSGPATGTGATSCASDYSRSARSTWT
jgi:hypothetical protein